ncbi:MAG: hypothetical protein ACKO8X_00915, partial [Verrucomicrobiota bacterium]
IVEYTYELNSTGGIKPFIGAGIGYGWLKNTVKSMGGTAEVHVWAKGGHGWGASDRCLAARRWTDLLGEWMRDQGLLQP